MEYLNDRMVLLAKVAHTRGLLDRAEPDTTRIASLTSLLDQQEAALNEYDARLKANADRLDDRKVN